MATPLLADPRLGWLGMISYGIFLWHFPVMLGLVDLGVVGWWPAEAYPVLVLTTLAVTIPCAALSYYAVERPLMRWKRSRSADPAPVTAAAELATG